MTFENDIFISYGHLDDRPLAEGSKGWVSALHRALEVRVGQLLGREPRIWRDPKLQGSDVLSDALLQNLPTSALLLAILSPRYVRSEWCTRELSDFFDAAEKSIGLRIGGKTRALKIVKTPVPEPEQPGPLREALGYDFYVLDPETGRPRELQQTFGPEAERQYWLKVDDLAFDLSELLSTLESAADTPLAASRTLAQNPQTVYLAESGADLKAQRESVRRDLLRRGHQLLPERALPLELEAFEASVRDCLSRSHLAVHPVGRNYGLIPDGATRSQVELQYELARERAEDPAFLQLIWLPPGLEVTDEREKSFIASLASRADELGNTDLLEIELEDLLSVVDGKLEALAARAGEATGPEAADKGHSRIYLIYDEPDGERARALEDFLFDSGFEVVTPVFDGDEAEIHHDHEESLRICDAALIYYGAGNELWLRSKLRDLVKSAGLGRKKELSAKAVYVGPPESPRKQRLRTREAVVIPGAEPFDPAVLRPFLERLK